MRTTSAPDNAEAHADRIASVVFMAGRGGQIVFSALMLANDRRRYDRPGLQTVALAGIVVESGWLSRRLIRARGYDDRVGVWVDCLSAAAALLISHRGLGTQGGAPWAKNVAIGAAIGAASARRTEDTIGTVGTLCAAAIATGLRARGRDAHVAGLALAVNDAVSWAGTHVASRSYLSAHRNYGRLRDEADALTVERAAASASEAERSRQHELLHQVTIGVLSGIADGAGLGAVVTAAGAEAARLRYALRAGGHVPQGLDRVLAEIAERASARGMRVELVTDGLGAVRGTGATAALGAATEKAVDTARELGGAVRTVVRAVSEDGIVTVTVRDHGRGFQPGAGSDYEWRLAGIRDLLRPWGGELMTRSEPGGGVRVTLNVSAGDSSADDAPDGVPDDRVRQRPAGDHDDAVADRDVYAGLAGGDLAGPQHQVRVAGIEETDVGAPRDPFQAGAQQGEPGSYSRRRNSMHSISIALLRRSGMGRTTQFDELPATQARSADRTLLTALLAWRATGLVTGAAALIAGRARYRSRRLAVAQLALAAGESAWYARRVLRGDRWSDTTASSIDAATAVTVVLLGRANLEYADRATWINWPPWTFAANVICGQAMGAASTAQALAGGAAVMGAHATQSRRAGDAVADSAALAAHFLVARLLAAQTRSSAVRLEQARGRAEAEGSRLAQARERSVQLRTLHDHALQTLETIASGRFTDLDMVRRHARAEAARLGRELSGADAAPQSFAGRLGTVLDEHPGLLIEFECPDLHDVSEPVIAAFCGAAGEALTNVRKHAQATQVRVAVKNAGDSLTITIADKGVGFDPLMARGGFGMRESIERRMREAGGAARVESAPGAGTRITLEWPA
ncbi:MAG: ATP-binding protein [Streptosporangiaceae bacterium]